jgi:membrane-bound lytic murein transglycosylase B
VPARLQGTPPQDWLNDGLKPERALADYVAAGLSPRTEVDASELAMAMALDGEEGREYWLGLHNFYVITRYNHSAMYALSVFQLAQALAEGEPA